MSLSQLQRSHLEFRLFPPPVSSLLWYALMWAVVLTHTQQIRLLILTTFCDSSYDYIDKI